MKGTRHLGFLVLLAGCTTTTSGLQGPSGSQQFRLRRQAYISTHPCLPEQTRNDILRGRIRLGMNPEEVVASWGPPDRQHRSIVGVNERWVYHKFSYQYGLRIMLRGEWCLYFQNDMLSSWSVDDDDEQ